MNLKQQQSKENMPEKNMGTPQDQQVTVETTAKKEQASPAEQFEAMLQNAQAHLEHGAQALGERIESITSVFSGGFNNLVQHLEENQTPEPHFGAPESTDPIQFTVTTQTQPSEQPVTDSANSSEIHTPPTTTGDSSINNEQQIQTQQPEANLKQEKPRDTKETVLQAFTNLKTKIKNEFAPENNPIEQQMTVAEALARNQTLGAQGRGLSPQAAERERILQAEILGVEPEALINDPELAAKKSHEFEERFKSPFPIGFIEDPRVRKVALAGSIGAALFLGPYTGLTGLSIYLEMESFTRKKKAYKAALLGDVESTLENAKAVEDNKRLQLLALTGALLTSGPSPLRIIGTGMEIGVSMLRYAASKIEMRQLESIYKPAQVKSNVFIDNAVVRRLPSWVASMDRTLAGISAINYSMATIGSLMIDVPASLLLAGGFNLAQFVAQGALPAGVVNAYNLAQFYMNINFVTALVPFGHAIYDMKRFFSTKKFAHQSAVMLRKAVEKIWRNEDKNGILQNYPQTKINPAVAPA